MKALFADFQFDKSDRRWSVSPCAGWIEDRLTGSAVRVGPVGHSKILITAVNSRRVDGFADIATGSMKDNVTRQLISVQNVPALQPEPYETACASFPSRSLMHH